jgi:hypothetical protein
MGAPAVSTSTVRHFVFRLKPGEDLLAGIRAVVEAEGLKAAVIVSAVGSLTRATLRFAHTGVWVVREGYFEIVSLVGSGEHVHIALSDREGVTFGAHFGPGSAVYTTAEVVLAELDGLVFGREECQESGWPELVVQRA